MLCVAYLFIFSSAMEYCRDWIGSRGRGNCIGRKKEVGGGQYGEEGGGVHCHCHVVSVYVVAVGM